MYNIFNIYNIYILLRSCAFSLFFTIDCHIYTYMYAHVWQSVVKNKLEAHERSNIYIYEIYIVQALNK